MMYCIINLLHQLWKANPKSAQTPIDIRSNGFPWWWNWLEHQLPAATASQTPKNSIPIITPPRPVSDYKASPQLNTTNYRHSSFTSDDHKDVRSKQALRPSKTPSPANCTPPTIKNSKSRGNTKNSVCDFPMKDDDSLTSCPAFSVPSYMSPTVSAKAKVRPNSNPKERLQGQTTPANDSKRRFSFSLTTNIGSTFKWNKGSSKESAPHKALQKHITPQSIGDLSIDSTVSMPAIGGRKPFNRFV